MLCEVLLAATFQIGPFYEQKPDAVAVRPFFSREGGTTDVLWPLFTSHRDWWRALFFLHYQENPRGHQFEAMPLFWTGASEGDGYWGVFPLFGTHPHFLLLYDWKFVLWPLWMRYETPRAGDEKRMETNAVLFPFFHWRDDGSWGFWPFYVRNHQRESFHQTALWPLVTWATYESDRDTAGEGTSWMVWPLAAHVARERERQWMVLPPFFSFTETSSRTRSDAGDSAPEFRVHCPWPLITCESTRSGSRFSVFPFYEHADLKSYSSKGEAAGRDSSVTRFGWKLVEIYDDETRVFPFWVSRADGTYFRLWPLWESETDSTGVRRSRFLSLFPIRHVPAVDRNWAKFWTFYERTEEINRTKHSLFWGLISWQTMPEVVCD